MSELQAVLEFQVELFKFFNIDLFQRGHYQIRTSLKTSPKVTAKVDAALSRTHGSRWKPSYVLGGTVGVSKTFQILYRKEDVELYDVFTFKVYMIVDINKIEQCLSDADFQLSVELWFTEEELRAETVLQQLSTRTASLHVKYDAGVHHYLPLQFDYFHLSTVLLTVHASLLALHPSYISLSAGAVSSRQSQQPVGAAGNVVSVKSDPTVLPTEFSRPALAPLSKSGNRRIQQAFNRHRSMCRILLCVYESLQSSFESLVLYLPSAKQIELEHVDCHARYEEMVAKCQRYSLIDEEDMVQATQSDISTLCGQNMLLWMQYLELVTFNKIITHRLAKEHHLQRVKRFAEGFFFNELRKQEMIMCFDPSIHGHANVTNAVRSSEYFQSVAPLSAECVELDGDVSSLPIIFEDVYTEQVVTSLSVTTTSDQRQQDSSVERSRSATVNSQVSCRSQVSTSSTLSRMSLVSAISSASDVGRKSSKLRLRARPESIVRGESLLVSDQPDCTLVGYRKVDISSSEFRPTVELGTLTTDSTHTPLLVGSGVLMQPSLLFNAVSLPTLPTSSNDRSVSLTGSMPALATNDDSSSECVLTPYWQSQQGKAQLVAQHSSEATATPCYFNADSNDVDDVSSSVDFTLGNNLDATVGVDLDKTMTIDLQRAVGNDMYTAVGIDLDTTLGRALHTAVSEDSMESEEVLLTAACDSQRHITDSTSNKAAADITSISTDITSHKVNADVTSDNAAADSTSDIAAADITRDSANITSISISASADITSDKVTADITSDNAAAADIISDKVNADITSDNAAAADVTSINASADITSDTTAAAMSNDELHSVSTSPNAAEADTDAASASLMKSATEDSKPACVTASLEDREQTHVGVSSLDMSSVNDDVADADGLGNTVSRDANVAGSQPGTDCLSSSLPASSSSSSLLFPVENSDEFTAATHKTSDSASCGQSSTDMKLSSVGEASSNVNADQSATELKQSSPDSPSNDVNSCQSVSDIADELSVVIPSSCDSVSDDERYLSGQCTLMELITEANDSDRLKGNGSPSERPRLDGTSAWLEDTSSSSDHTRFVSCDDIGLRLSGATQQQQQHVADVNDVSIADLTNRNVARHGATDNLSKRLIAVVSDDTIQFIGAKEKLRKQLNYSGHFYSDLPSVVSVWPYFWPADIPHPDDGVHLVVCVHGLDGNSTDLRLVKTYLELALPGGRLDFLMSERNQTDTFADFEVMTDRLVSEIMYHIELFGMKPTRISFIGHSLGNLIIRSAMSRPQMAELLPRLHTFLSLSGPHLGTLFNSSGLVNMGMWLMQKWKKSGSLLQLSLKDHPDPRQTFLYKLSQKTGLEFFRNILLVGSQQDRYVPYHSSRIELCRAAVKDSSGLGAVYTEMVNNILQPVIYKSDINFIRYDVSHALPSSTTNNLIGRAAHIAVLDSEIFIEKFISVAVLKYFI